MHCQGITCTRSFEAGLTSAEDQKLKCFNDKYVYKCYDNPGKSSYRLRLSTVDLLALTSLDQLLFILKILFTFFTKQATLMRRSIVLNIPLH